MDARKVIKKYWLYFLLIFSCIFTYTFDFSLPLTVYGQSVSSDTATTGTADSSAPSEQSENAVDDNSGNQIIVEDTNTTDDEGSEPPEATSPTETAEDYSEQQSETTNEAPSDQEPLEDQPITDDTNSTDPDTSSQGNNDSTITGQDNPTSEEPATTNDTVYEIPDLQETDTVPEVVYDLPPLDELLNLQPLPELGAEVVANIVYSNISGCLTDNYNGNPLEGVAVTLTASNAVYKAITDKNGCYNLIIPEDNYELSFWLYGFGQEKFVVSLFDDDVQDCTLCKLVPVTINTSLTNTAIKLEKAKINEEPNFSSPDYEFTSGENGSTKYVMLPAGRYYAKIGKSSDLVECWIANEKNYISL